MENAITNGKRPYNTVIVAVVVHTVLEERLTRRLIASAVFCQALPMNGIQSKMLEKTPSMFTRGSSELIWWRCEFGHEWKASIQNRSRGHGCPICARIQRGKNDLLTLFPEIAKEWHPIKNGTLTPQDVGRGSRQKVWWICKCSHERQAAINNRVRGTGCPYCSGHKK